MQTIIFYAAAGNPLAVVRDSGNSAGACAPAFTAGSPVLLKLRLFADVTSPEALPISTFAGIDGWSFELDNDYDQRTPCKIVADNDSITLSTVDEGGRTYTEFAIPISNTYTEEVATALGTSPRIGVNGELVGYRGGEACYVLQIRGFSVLNRISGLTEPTPIPPANYERIASAAVSGAIVESGLATSADAQAIADQQIADSRLVTSSGARQIANSAASGAIFSGAEFDTVIGSTRITATSGGVLVSAGGAVVNISSGAIVGSGASGESMVLSGGEVGVFAGNTSMRLNNGGFRIETPTESMSFDGYDIYLRGEKVLTELATSTDTTTTSASFEVLEGGTSYIYTQPLTSIGIASIGDGARAELDFTAGANFTPGLPASAKRLGVSSCDSGSHYLIAVYGARVVVNEYKTGA